MAKQDKAFEFGPFRLEVRERRLTCDGHAVPLRGRVFNTLCALVSRHGCLVTKDELMATIWPDSVVEESNLNHNICVLRRALGEKATGQKYVETVPRQGYRFVAEVRELDCTERPDSLTTWDIQVDMRAAGEYNLEETLSPADPQIQAGRPGAPPEPRSRSHGPWHRHQGVIPSLVVAILLVGGYFGVEQFRFMETRSHSRVMVAVLPFENMTGDSSQKYVADGLSHEIISQLGRWNTERVGVIARTSTKVYDGAPKSISEIGRELGVDYVVEGSLRLNENTYRITVMLIRVEDQAHLWVANYNREADSITALQVEVAKIVMREIGRKLEVKAEEGTPSASSRSLERAPNHLHDLQGVAWNEFQFVHVGPWRVNSLLQLNIYLANSNLRRGPIRTIP